MRRFALLLCTLCFALAGCAQEKMMTSEGYAEVEEGMSVKELKKRYGTPYTIYSKGADTETYEYIERMRMGRRVVEQRRYYVVISGGKVIAKYMKVSNPPPFQEMYSDSPYPDY